MGKDSSIEWCDHTHNWWHGCCKVSDGCKNCYAETLDRRFGRAVWGPAKTTPRMMMSENYWRQPLKWNAAAEKAGKRARVFCSSMADVFEDHPGVVEARARGFALIEQTPNLDWLLLTKRPENIDRMLPERWHRADQGFPRNVWLGFSAEDRQRFDERWQIMEWVKRMWHPSVVFCSAEPLLGALDISDALTEIDLGDEDHQVWSATLDWVIVGGESGHGARPMHPDWARSLRDQCVAAGIAYHFKQFGEYLPKGQGHVSLTEQQLFYREEYINGQGYYRVGKHASGRLLDGVEWNQFPDVR